MAKSPAEKKTQRDKTMKESSSLDATKHHPDADIEKMSSEDVAEKLRQHGIDETQIVKKIEGLLGNQTGQEFKDRIAELKQAIGELEVCESALNKEVKRPASRSEPQQRACGGVRGDLVIAWLERWSERFLWGSQPELYQMLMLHVGATNKLRHSSDSDAYWQYVQAILDCFFSAAERAEMCADLMKEKHFVDDPACASFLHQAKAEMRCREVTGAVEATVEIKNRTMRGVG